MKIEGNTLSNVTVRDIKNEVFIIPEGVTHIGDHAFAGCKALTQVHFPESVMHIGNSAFEGCETLTEVHIPESVTHISNSAFAGCKALTQVHIPESVTHISKYAFAGCETLTEAHIPEGVTHIGNFAFAWCTVLTQVHIPDSGMYIGGSAFAWCKALTEVHIPEGVTHIGDSAFGWCEALTEVHLSVSVTHIGNSAFAWCTALTEVHIPEGVTHIGDHALDWCTALTRINWKGKSYEVECVDGRCMEVIQRKHLGDIELLKARYFPEGELCHVAKRGNLAAHGKLIKDAVRDLTFKEQECLDVSVHVARVKAAGIVTPDDYRLITGACLLGTQRFLEENGLVWEDALPIADVCKLVDGQWGAETFLSYFCK